MLFLSFFAVFFSPVTERERERERNREKIHRASHFLLSVCRLPSFGFLQLKRWVSTSLFLRPIGSSRGALHANRSPDLRAGVKGGRLDSRQSPAAPWKLNHLVLSMRVVRRLCSFLFLLSSLFCWMSPCSLLRRAPARRFEPSLQFRSRLREDKAN